MINENEHLGFEEINEKMKSLHKILEKDLFSNPIREVQHNIRSELLDFKNIFERNLDDLEKYLESSESHNVSVKPTTETVKYVSGSEDMLPKSEVDKREYQILHLKRAFEKHEKSTSTELNDLKSENDKLNYRMKILLNKIDKLENGIK